MWGGGGTHQKSSGEPHSAFRLIVRSLGSQMVGLRSGNLTVWARVLAINEDGAVAVAVVAGHPLGVHHDGPLRVGPAGDVTSAVEQELGVAARNLLPRHSIAFIATFQDSGTQRRNMYVYIDVSNVGVVVLCR